MLAVPYDDGKAALALLGQHGIRNSVVYKRFDDVELAAFDAAQALGPFKIRNDARATSYLISVIVNAMKDVKLTVRKDVLSCNAEYASKVEYALKRNNEDFEFGDFNDEIYPNEDDELLCEAGDQIDNAVFDAINALSPQKLEWDMCFIGHVTIALEKAMESFEIPACHP